jgi:hypothetical protein
MKTNAEYRRYCKLIACHKQILAGVGPTPAPRAGDFIVANTAIGPTIVLVNSIRKGRIYAETAFVPYDPVSPPPECRELEVHMAGPNLRYAYQELLDVYKQIREITDEHPEFPRAYRRHVRFAEYARDIRKLRPNVDLLMIDARFAARSRKNAGFWYIARTGKDCVTIYRDNQPVWRDIPIKRAARVLSYMTRWHTTKFLLDEVKSGYWQPAS